MVIDGSIFLLRMKFLVISFRIEIDKTIEYDFDTFGYIPVKAKINWLDRSIMVFMWFVLIFVFKEFFFCIFFIK